MSAPEPLPEVRQSPENVSGRLLAGIIVGSVVVTLVCIVVARAILRTDRGDLGDVARTPAYPVSATVGEIDQLPITGAARGGERLSESESALHRYGWVDERRGIAQIPIDRAMQWLADDAKRGRLESPDPATTPDAGARAEAR